MPRSVAEPVPCHGSCCPFCRTGKGLTVCAGTCPVQGLVDGMNKPRGRKRVCAAAALGDSCVAKQFWGERRTAVKLRAQHG